MDAGSQPSLRDQLFESAAVVLDILNRVGSSELVGLDTLEEGMRSLQDTLLGSDYISTPELDPFYLLCLQLCDAISKQSSLNGSTFELASDSVTGHGLGELREVLLASFHALNTYLNIIRWYVKSVSFGWQYTKISVSAPGKFDDNTKRRCMACVSCAIRDLEKHRVHLNGLDESVPVLLQLHLTSTCLLMFNERLRDFGVDRYQQNECGCLDQGSNRMSSWKDDIVIIRVGQDAMEHFAKFGEKLLKEISRRRRLEEDKSLEEISRTYEDVEGRFQAALHHLEHGEDIISFEILTRGYRLDFMGMSQAGLGQLGFT